MKKAYNFIHVLILLLMVDCLPIDKCDTYPAAYNIHLNSIEIQSIDNSFRKFDSNDISTTIPRDALAFNLLLTDTLFCYSDTDLIREAKIECDHYIVDYFGVQLYNNPVIKAIKMHTVYNYNDSLKAGDDLSPEILVFRNPYSHKDYREFYTPINSVINDQKTNWASTYHGATIQLQLILKKVSNADSMKVEVIVEFEDETSLCQESGTIYLRNE